MRILVTGAAGFIGSHLTEELLGEENEIVGIDNLNDYYSPNLKNLRLHQLNQRKNFTFSNLDISNLSEVRKLVAAFSPEYIFHLAAQAGVRLPVNSYDRYIGSNLVGFSNVAISALEFQVPNFLYASSSSVYGNSTSFPYSEEEKGLVQESFYGATKYSNEILARSLSINSKTKFRGLRFFTVYGPMGRPDMAYFRLINAAINNKPFHLFGDGEIRRDFTYISDVVTSIRLLASELGKRTYGFSDVVNVGGGKPNSITELIDCINKITGAKVKVELQKSVASDVKETIASQLLQSKLTGFVPNISLEQGVRKVFDWASDPEISTRLNSWVG